MIAPNYFLDRHVREQRGSRTALRSVDADPLSYADVANLSIRAARGFAARGVRHGDRVLLLLPDCIELVAATFGLMRLGAIAVPVSPQLTESELRAIVDDCRPRGVVLRAVQVRAQSRLWMEAGMPTCYVVGDAPPDQFINFEQLLQPRAEAVGSSVTPDDPALIQYTSGSTGAPKGVVHRHHALVAVTEGFPRRLGMAETDVCFSAAKISFGYGFGNSLLFPLAVGASAVLCSAPSEPFTVLNVIARFRPTMLFGVPSLYARILDIPGAADKYDLSSLRCCVSAGEHLTARLFERWQAAFGHELVDGLGATECLHIFISAEPRRVVPGSTGSVLPGYEVRLVDDHGRDVPDGEVGLLRIQSPCNADRYWNRGQTGNTIAGAWVQTGDLLQRRDDGLYFWVGRADDVVKIGGFKVVPQEVEAYLLEHEAVLECAVVSQMSADGIAELVAFVRTRDNWPANDNTRLALRDHLRTGLATHKRPSRLQFVSALPRTSTGKLARRAIAVLR